MTRKAFNFYRSYYDVAKELKDTDRAKYLWAILQKQFEGIEPTLEGMAKFAYISQQHSIDAQVIGYELKTKTKLEPEVGGTGGGTGGGSGQGKGKGKEEYTDFKSALLKLGVTKQLVTEWLLVRRNKSLANTETAFNRLKKEIEKSGALPNDVIKLCVEKSWGGFDAEWYAKHKPALPNKPISEMSEEEKHKLFFG